MMQKNYVTTIRCGVALGLGLTLTSLLMAQRSDSYEGGDPRWLLVESDCQAQLTEHEISLLMPHSGRTCEQFEVACGNGRLVLMAYPIEPCIALNEFRPRIWTRCSSGRIQLGVRVVFPSAEHPVTLGRLNTILWGDLYSDTGQWQALQVTELERRLQEEIVSLRQKFGPDLDLEGAFIDALVLNVYTGPGRYRVQVDDLELRGMIPVASLGIPLSPNWRERWRWRHATPSAEERFWAAANRPPVWLQYQGESLPWLSSLGINGLMLNQLPSERQLERMKDASLDVISPPPPHSLTIKPEVAGVLRGWLVGAALDARQANIAREQVRLVQQLPRELHRPLIGEALEHYWQFSRIADEVIVPVPSPVAAGGGLDKLSWLSQQVQTTRQRGSGWTSLNVGEVPAVVDQYRAANKVLFANADEATFDAPTNPLGLRHQAISAVLAGSQGLLLRTFKPLDIQHAGDSANIAAVRWVTSDLELWGPWIMAGQATQPPTLSRTDFVASGWSLPDSQLIIAQTATDSSQFCIPATREAPLEFGMPPRSNSQQVLRLTGGTLERVETSPSATGLTWTVEDPAPIESFVVTNSPRVLNFLRRKLAATAEQNASNQLEIVAYNLTVAAEVTGARFSVRDQSPAGRTAREAQFRRIASAQQLLDKGWQQLRAKEIRAATALAFEASDSIQAMLYDAHLTAISNLASPQSSPFVVNPALLGYHWMLAEACERSQWRPLPLPGAELGNLNELLESGWSQQRRLEERVDLRVEVVPAGYERNGGLRMAAYQKVDQPADTPVPGGYEGASLRVRSAAADIKAGQLVRISATARILRGTTTPDSGLLVYDNQAGPGLGQLVRGETGQQVKVELYRFAVADGEFRILAECRGECDLVLEAIQASVIEPATNRRSYPTGPVGSLPATVIGEVYSDQ